MLNQDSSKEKNYVKFNKDNIFAKRKTDILLRKFIFLLKGLLTFTVILSVFLYRAYLYQNIQNVVIKSSEFLGLKFEHLVIEGRNNAMIDDILLSLNIKPRSSIFLADLHEIRKQILQNPWVKNAIVARKLPNIINIQVTEHVPIAIWQYKKNLMIIDKDGDVIQYKNIQKFAHLLHVVGKYANIHCYNLLNQLSKYPSINAILKNASRLGNRRWDFVLSNGIIVKMPENNFDHAMRYLNSLIQTNQLTENNIKMIDLRNHKKHYIEYKS